MDTNHHETEWAGGPSRSILIGVNSCHFVAILCLLLAVLAEAGEIEYHPTLDAAIEAATKGHQLVMVILVGPGTDPQGRDVCKLFREETLPDSEIAKLIKAHFAPFLVDIAEVRAGRQAIPPAVQACLKPNEPIMVPSALFLDAKCKEVDRIGGYAPPMQYIGQLKRVVEKAIGKGDAADKPSGQFRKLDTPHFEVSFTVPPLLGKGYAALCEKAFGRFCEIFNVPEGETVWDGKCRVFLFANREQFEKFAMATDGPGTAI